MTILFVTLLFLSAALIFGDGIAPDGPAYDGQVSSPWLFTGAGVASAGDAGVSSNKKYAFNDGICQCKVTCACDRSKICTPPTGQPTSVPSSIPSHKPTPVPTVSPTRAPTVSPTRTPSTRTPTTRYPTIYPTTPGTPNPTVTPTYPYVFVANMSRLPPFPWTLSAHLTCIMVLL